VIGLPNTAVQPIQEIITNSARTYFQEETVSSPIYSFAVGDLIAEKGDEASSSQALSEENQAKLKEIYSLLQRDVQDQVKDADLLREALELIDQDLPADIKASLEPISKLDDHFVAVKQALKNLSSQPALEQKQAANKKSVKDLHIQMQNHKELLTNLQSALELKKARKAELEAKLRTLTIEIEADEKKMAELPESMKKIRKEAIVTMIAGKQLKTKLSALSKTQEADQRLLENINKMISDASNVISKYLGV
jgi:chromosome segregation ATPase